jgi:hypothetical protein
MIGGIDTFIATRADMASVEVAVRAIRQIWSDATFENGLTGERYDNFSDIPFGVIEELLIYKDVESAELWDNEGAVPGAFNTMVHVIKDIDMIAVVIDEMNDEMSVIIATIKSGLSDDILYIPAELSVAA